MRSLILVSITATAAVTTGLWLSRSDPMPVVSSAATPEVSPTARHATAALDLERTARTSAAALQQTSALSAELARLKQNVVELEAQAERTTAEPEAPTAASPPTPEEIAAREAAFEDELWANFESEPRDADFADSAEGELGPMLEVLGGETSSRDLNCRSSWCRAEVQHAEDGGHEALIGRARQRLDWPGPVHVHDSEVDGQRISVLYFGKPDARFPDPLALGN